MRTRAEAPVILSVAVRPRTMLVLALALLEPMRAAKQGTKETCSCNNDLFLPSIAFSSFVLIASLLYGAYHLATWLGPRLWNNSLGKESISNAKVNETSRLSAPARSERRRRSVGGKGNKIARSKQKLMNLHKKDETITLNVQVPPTKKEERDEISGGIVRSFKDNLSRRRGPPTAECSAWSIPFRELKLGRQIGAGNVGVVHEGEWHGTKVAVKKLVGQWLKNEDMVMRFREEINLMSTLHHPNVLMFIGAVMDPDAGNICLVTELCVHGDLYTFLHAPETKMTWKLRLIMATDIARGMLYLHRRAGIIQRDLKTANCLLDEHYHIKIADFGLSRRLAPGNMETYCGTPATMAPEIVCQDDYDEKADVFSFAITLWELVTGEEPYPYLTGMTLAFQVAQKGLRPTIPSYCPEEVATIIERCWHHQPEMRPSFQQILDELQQLQSIIRQIRTTQGTRIFQRATTPSPCASPDIQAATLSLNSTRRDGSSRDGENRAYVSPRLVESRLPRRNESRVSLSEVSVAEIAEENDSMCYNMVERLKNEMVDKAIESQVTFQGSKEAGCVATSEPNSVASSPSTPKRRVSLSDVLNDLNARTRSPSPLIPEK